MSYIIKEGSPASLQTLLNSIKERVIGSPVLTASPSGLNYCIIVEVDDDGEEDEWADADDYDPAENSLPPLTRVVGDYF